jgi:hypothetical protein
VDNKNQNRKEKAPVDSAYGGCQYRLSYEVAQRKRDIKSGKIKKQQEHTSFADTTKRVVAVLALLTVFALLGASILAYFNSEVKRLYTSYSANDDEYGYENVNVIE